MSCGKIGYRTRKEAKHAVKEMKQKKRIQKGGGSVYKCQECNSWHVTSQSPQKRRRIRDMKERGFIK